MSLPTGSCRSFALTAFAVVTATLAFAEAPQAAGAAAGPPCAKAVRISGQRTVLVPLRATSCSTAARVARGFDRDRTPSGWSCALSKAPFDRLDGRLVSLSCGYRSGAGDLRRARRAFVGTVASASADTVIDCALVATGTTVVSSARNMSCADARRRLRSYRGEITATIRLGDGFRCVQQSGGMLSGQWRCVSGHRAFRFEFRD